jgi:hypothetical protein
LTKFLFGDSITLQATVHALSSLAEVIQIEMILKIAEASAVLAIVAIFVWIFDISLANRNSAFWMKRRGYTLMLSTLNVRQIVNATM